MSLINEIKLAKQILVVGHMRPDGDCFGSGLALYYICEKLGKKVDFMIDSALPDHYSFIKRFDKINVKSCLKYDLAISIDCADELRLGSYYEDFKRCNKSINIDHHVTNTKFAKQNIIKDVSSTCELLYTLIADDGVIDDQVAEYLYIGLSTDTGHFRHSNVSSDTLYIASRLFEYNFDKQSIHNYLYKNYTINQMNLITASVGAIKYYVNNKIAIITITKKMLDDCNCTIADTESIIDYGISIGCVEVCICMTQQAQHSYKVSFRSKSINVAHSAQTFGGGGHALASGCVVNGFYEDCISKLIKSVTDEMV